MYLKQTAFFFSICLLLVVSAYWPIVHAQIEFAEGERAADEFTHQSESEWFNSPPLSLKKDLRGKVVLLDFWTFECWNCYRSFPWLNAMEKRLDDENFVVIGVHSPEFEREKDPKSVARKIEEFELKHPIMLDNDFSYWNTMNNRFWPAFYLIDKRGDVRQIMIGETHEGDRKAKQLETRIRELLAETA